MIDAGPSLEAAAEISAASLAVYLKSRGWSVRETGVPDATLFFRRLPGADDAIYIVLPATPNFDDERRRLADALRTLETIEERPIPSILEDVRQTVQKSSEETLDTASRNRPTSQREGYKQLKVAISKEIMDKIIAYRSARKIDSKNEAVMDLLRQAPSRSKGKRSIT